MPSWITVQPTSGDGSEKVTVSVAENDNENARSGTVTISTTNSVGDKKTVTLTVTQNGKPEGADVIQVSFYRLLNNPTIPKLVFFHQGEVKPTVTEVLIGKNTIPLNWGSYNSALGGYAVFYDDNNGYLNISDWYLLSEGANIPEIGTNGVYGGYNFELRKMWVTVSFRNVAFRTVDTGSTSDSGYFMDCEVSLYTTMYNLNTYLVYDDSLKPDQPLYSLNAIMSYDELGGATSQQKTVQFWLTFNRTGQASSDVSQWYASNNNMCGEQFHNEYTDVQIQLPSQKVYDSLTDSGAYDLDRSAWSFQ